MKAAPLAAAVVCAAFAGFAVKRRAEARRSPCETSDFGKTSVVPASYRQCRSVRVSEEFGQALDRFFANHARINRLSTRRGRLISRVQAALKVCVRRVLGSTASSVRADLRVHDGERP